MTLGVGASLNESLGLESGETALLSKASGTPSALGPVVELSTDLKTAPQPAQPVSAPEIKFDDLIAAAPRSTSGPSGP